MNASQILVVEDEMIVADSIRAQLENLGYKVLDIVLSGEKAIQKAAAGRPDLVLMDIRLAGEIDGIEAAAQIQDRFDIPIVYLTAHADEETLQRAKITKPFGYILKPFQIEALCSVIEMALYKHHLEQRLKESEARYRSISELTSDFAYSFRVEPGGSLTAEWVTEAFTRITGYTLEGPGTPEGWRKVIHPHNISSFLDHVRTLLSGQEESREFRLITKNNEVRWVQSYSRPVWDETQNRVERIIGAAQDITERKQMETALQYRLEMEELVASLSTRFINLTFEQIDPEINQALQTIGKFAGVDRAYLNLFSPDGKTIEHIYEWHAVNLESKAKSYQELAVEPLQWSMTKLNQFETIYVSQVANLPPEASVEKAIWETQAVQSVLTIPLILENSLVGILGFTSERAPKTWLEEDVRLLKLVGEIFTNLLGRKRMEETLRETEERYRTLFEETINPILIIDTEGNYIDCNQAALQFLECSRDELLSKNVGDFLPPPPNNLVIKNHHHLWEQGGAIETEYYIDGRIKVLELAITPGIWRGKQVVFGIGKDITDRLQAERSLRESNRRLAETLTELQATQQQVIQQERLAAVGQLAAGIAHDFNNLLTSIIGFAELLQMDPDLPLATQADLARIVQQGKRGAHLVQQILDFARKAIRRPQPLDLVPFIKNVAVGLEADILPENIHIRLQIMPEQLLVEADPDQLEQLLINLALNARDAMPGGGELRLGLTDLDLKVGDQPPCADMPPGQWAVLSVADTGTGISPQVLPHIFEPFFTTKEPGRGSGLGLAQVYGIVKQHEGYLKAASQRGQGTTITIYLPLREDI